MNKGFTLIEVIIVSAIIAIVSAITFTSFYSLNQRQAKEKDVMAVQAALNEARSRTISSKGPAQYGVHLEEFRVVLFRGTTYSASDAENEVINLSTKSRISSISLSGGGSDIIFSRLTGAANKSGTITVALRSDSTDTKVITVYTTGIVQSNI